MNLEQAFLDSICENPDDPALWLILADWLEEHDDPRAELVRLTQSLRHEPDHPDFDARQRRVQALLAGGMKPLAPTITNSLGMELALIPPGSFIMGSPVTELERRPHEPLHRVRISQPFYFGIHPVTQSQYVAVLGDNPSRHVDPLHPVENINWFDAVRFCERLSERSEERRLGRRYRLPTEAEWEYACRAGTRTVFHFGDAIGAEHAKFNTQHPYGGSAVSPYVRHTVPIGCFPPNAWGLYDLHGNVVCWCQDWFSELEASEQVDPTGPPEGAYRIVRGGAWCFHGCYCRAAYRNHSSPSSPREFYGVRVVCTLEASPLP